MTSVAYFRVHSDTSATSAHPLIAGDEEKLPDVLASHVKHVDVYACIDWIANIAGVENIPRIHGILHGSQTRACSAITPATQSINTRNFALTCRFGGNAMHSGIGSRCQPSNRGTSNAPHPTLTDVGVTWLYGFQFEIKVIAKLPESSQG